jgi:RNA polymerase sigma-70 factor (ECF subfamily)
MSSDHEGGARAPHREAGGAGEPLDMLYRDHAPRLRRRLHARLGPDDANEIVQDAFARLLGASPLGRLREPGAFLNRIVRNLLIDRSRRLATRSPHLPLDYDVEIAVPPDQGDAIEVEQMRQRYREVVASLPDRMREVFVLHRVEELSYKEIAARLNISVRTVEWHIAEAIVRIGKGLDSE